MPSAAIPWTTIPAISAVGFLAVTRSRMRRNASRTSAALDRPSSTPPTSLLWVIWADSILRTTGKPMRSEALAASSAFRVNRVGTTGMPKESSKRNAASAGKIPAGNLECDEADGASF